MVGCNKQQRFVTALKPFDLTSWNIEIQVRETFVTDSVSVTFRSRILVEGKLDYGEYVDKNQVRRQATTIIAGQKPHTHMFNCIRHDVLKHNLSHVYVLRQHHLPQRQRARENLKASPCPTSNNTTTFVFFLFKQKTETCEGTQRGQNKLWWTTHYLTRAPPAGAKD